MDEKSKSVMDKEKALNGHPELQKNLNAITELNVFLESEFQKQFNRSLPMTDHFNDRWQRAQRLGFGKGSNIYDSSYVIGKVTVGENCWIGMFTILDGSGGLSIGNNCTVSAGVHIYTHDNVKATLSNNQLEIERNEVVIGNNCYIAPHSIIVKNVTLGNSCVVAAQSFVNKSFPDFSIIAGTPAKQIGVVKINGNQISFEYFKNQ